MKGIEFREDGLAMTILFRKIAKTHVREIGRFYREVMPGSIVLMAIAAGATGDIGQAMNIAARIQEEQTTKTISVALGDVTVPGLVLSLGASLRLAASSAHFGNVQEIGIQQSRFIRENSRRKLPPHMVRMLCLGVSLSAANARGFGLTDGVFTTWDEVVLTVQRERDAMKKLEEARQRWSDQASAVRQLRLEIDQKQTMIREFEHQRTRCKFKIDAAPPNFEAHIAELKVMTDRLRDEEQRLQEFQESAERELVKVFPDALKDVG